MKQKQTMNLLLLVGVGIGALWLWRKSKGEVIDKSEVAFASFTNYGLGGLVQTTKTPPPTGHILADIKLGQKYGSLGFCGSC